jgi:molybdopterin molybdotransferase
MDPHDGEALALADALERILAEIDPVEGIETVDVRSALGRVLATDVVAAVDVPPHTNSAMDGYALAGNELPTDGPRTLTVAGTAWAGRPFNGAVEPGHCVRIMTGAPMPRGCDTVVIQEHVLRDGDTATIGPDQRAGQHVRPAGEDIAAGEIALATGTHLQPAHLGLLASLGIGEVKVRRLPVVAFFSTGDELRGIGEVLEDGQIYDSNRYSLYGMLTRLGVRVLDLGVVRDNRADVEQAFVEAARMADAIITSGGVSVGEADFVTDTLAEVGQVNFWKIAMKPGRPVAFGRVGDALFFGLPGNPVSVMATFYQVVQPALRSLMGLRRVAPDTLVAAICETGLRKKPGRLEFQRGILSRRADGEYVVRGTDHQGAGVLRSMAEANCFIVLALEQGRVEPGARVSVQPFSALI